MNQDKLLKATYFKLGWTDVDDNGDLVVDNTCRFPITGVTFLIEQVLDEYNTLVPRKKIHRIEDSTDDRGQFFQLPVEASSILDVYYQLDSDIGVSPDIPEVIHAHKYEYSEDLLETLLNTHRVDEIVEYNRVLGADYQFVTGNSIQLLRRAKVNKIYVLYNYPRALSDVSDMATFKFASRLAVVAIEAYVSGKERSVGMQRAGGLKEYDGGSTYLTLSDRYQRDWDNWIEGESKRAFVGLNDALVKPT